LFSFSRRTTAHFFVLSLSFSRCYSPHHVALLLSYSPHCSPLHAAWLSFSCCCFPLQLFFYFRCKILRVAIGVLLLVEESCTTPLHSFLQELKVVGNQESKTCIFSINIFPFAYFHYLFIYISCILFYFVLFFWLLVCGARLIITCFGDKHKPLYF